MKHNSTGQVEIHIISNGKPLETYKDSALKLDVTSNQMIDLHYSLDYR